jgi:hypothetical protein
MVFSTRWVPLHDTDTDGFAVSNANAFAKSRGATGREHQVSDRRAATDTSNAAG